MGRNKLGNRPRSMRGAVVASEMVEGASGGGAAPEPAAPPPPEPWTPTPAGPSLRTALLRRLALAALVPVALLGMWELMSAYRAERQRLTDQLQMSAMLSATAVDDFVQAQLAGVSLLASEPRKESGWDADLLRLRAQYPALRTTLVTDARGRIVASSPTGNWLNQRVEDRDYFKVPARTGKPYLSDAFTGRGYASDPLVAVSAPVFEDGYFAGVVEGSIWVDSFTRMRSAELQQRGFEMLILDRERHVVHATAGLDFAFDQDLSGARFLKASPDISTSQVRSAMGLLESGERAFVAQAPTRAGWTVLLMAPHSAIDSPLARRLAIFLGMLALAALGTWAVLRVQARRFTALMENLLGALHSMATRQAVAPLRLEEVPVELRPLAQSIDELAHQLEDAQYDNEELDRLTRTDALTAALNRRGFDDRVRKLLDPRTRRIGRAVAVLAFDIDYFKLFNDRYGHLAGDAALRRVAGAIGGCLRGQDDVLARTGGEEFVALLVDADRHTAYEVAERARHAVTEMGIPHEDSPTGVLTISAGLYVAMAGARPMALVEHADQALYRAKREGRDRVAE